MIIAVDGPAASGKGTLARTLAKRLNLPHLDTGAIYRAVAMTLIQRGHTAKNIDCAIEIAEELSGGIPQSVLNDPGLRDELVSQTASAISVNPALREHLVDLQRQFADQPGGAVLDGRDIGTVIAPHAEVKLYITAPTEIRAQRRFKELQKHGQKVTYEAVLEDLLARDKRDASRATAPTKPAEDAVTIDNGNLSIDEVLDIALRVVKSKAGTG